MLLKDSPTKRLMEVHPLLGLLQALMEHTLPMVTSSLPTDTPLSNSSTPVTPLNMANPIPVMLPGDPLTPKVILLSNILGILLIPVTQGRILSSTLDTRPQEAIRHRALLVTILATPQHLAPDMVNNTHLPLEHLLKLQERLPPRLLLHRHQR